MTKLTGLEWLKAHRDHKGDDCLIWPLSLSRGYAQLGVGRKVVKGHRLMCEMAHGRPPAPEYEAAHSCGQGHRGCVNPRHLSWKTREENQRDRRKHGTAGRAVERGYRRYKLTPEDVLTIRAMPEPVNRDAVAKLYGVDQSTIRMILKGETWKTIPPRLIAPQDALRIRQLKGKMKHKAIAAKFGVSKGTVARIMTVDKAWGADLAAADRQAEKGDPKEIPSHD